MKIKNVLFGVKIDKIVIISYQKQPKIHKQNKE